MVNMQTIDQMQWLINNIYAYGFKSNSVKLTMMDVINYNNGDLSFGEWQTVIPSEVDNVEDIFINKAESVTISGFGSEAIAISEGANSGVKLQNFHGLAQTQKLL